MEARINIINHSYIQALDVWEQEKRGGKKNRRTRIVNVYYNHLWPDQAWTEAGSCTRRKALADADWNSIIEGKVVLLGDFKLIAQNGTYTAGKGWR